MQPFEHMISQLLNSDALRTMQYQAQQRLAEVTHVSVIHLAKQSSVQQ